MRITCFHNKWCDNRIVPYKRAATIHIICAVLHIGSTLFIAMYALQKGNVLADFNTYVDKAFFSYTDWGERCYNATNASYSSDEATVEACADEDTLFYINRQGRNTFKGKVNILLLALTFTTVSGMVHAIAASVVLTKKALAPETETWLRFVFDYGFSASAMLCVVNITYGANNVSGVILAPVGLFGLLVLSAALLTRTVAEDVNPQEVKADISNIGLKSVGTEPPQKPQVSLFKSNGWVRIMFLVLVLLYIVVLVPTIVAVGRVGSVAPPGVVVFLSGMVVAFSSFIVPYCYELWKRRYCVFVGYAALSVIAKAMLHAFLAVSVLQQRTLYLNFDNATATPPESMADETTAYLIITVIPASGFVLFFVIYLTLNPLANVATDNTQALIW